MLLSSSVDTELFAGWYDGGGHLFRQVHSVTVFCSATAKDINTDDDDDHNGEDNLR